MTWTRLCRVVGLAGATSFLGPGVARAQPTAERPVDPIAAQALFDAARELMAQKDFAAACPKLEESQRRQPGGGTMMYLALCHEGEGKTATAWAEFGEVLSQAIRDRRADRERVAREHLQTLEHRLVRLEVDVADATATLEGLVVKRDGEPLERALWRAPIPVDPGTHVVGAVAPAASPWSTTFSATEEGATVRIEVPALEPAPPPRRPETPAATSSPAPKSHADREASRLGPRRAVALALGGFAVAGLAIGTAYTFQALGKKSEAERLCPGGSEGPCASEGVSKSKAAVSDGNIATAAFVSAGVLIGAAAVLWLTAPNGRPTAAVAVGPTGVQLSSAF